MNVPTDFANLHTLLSGYLKDPSLRAARHSRSNRLALQAKELNNQCDSERIQQHNTQELAITFLNEAFSQFEITKKMESNILDTTRLCFRALREVDTTDLSLLKKEFEFINILIQLGHYHDAFMELNIAFTQIHHMAAKEAAQKFSISQLLHGHELRNSKLALATFQIQLLTLRLISYIRTSGNPPLTLGPLPSTQEIITLTSAESNLYHWSDRAGAAEEVAEMLVLLSSVENSDLKINMLYLAMEYLSLNRTIHSELVVSAIDLFSEQVKLIGESSIYQTSSGHFHSLCLRWLKNELSLEPLAFLIQQYEILAFIDHSYAWDELLGTISCKTLSFLKKRKPYLFFLFESLDPSDDLNCEILSSALKLESSAPLTKDDGFSHLAFSLLKCLHFEHQAHQTVISSLLICYRNAAYLFTSSKQFGLLDFITIAIKNLDASEHASFAFEILNLLFDLLRETTQTKRLRNFSNLFFHFGGQLLTMESDKAVQFWYRCLEVEYAILLSDKSQFQENFPPLRSKCERIANLLIETSNLNHALTFIAKGFRYFEFIHEFASPFEYQESLSRDLAVSLKLLSKLICKSTVPVTLEKIALNELTRVFIAIEAIRLLTATKFPSKKEAISHLIVGIKDDLQDNGLFLFFLSSISFTIEFNLALKSVSELAFESNSQLSDYKDLILSHIHLLQSCSAKQLDQKMLQKAYQLALMWSQTPQHYGFISCYEFDVIMMVISVLHYTGINSHACSLTEAYIERCRNVCNGDQLLELELKLFEIKISLKLLSSASSVLTDIDTGSSSANVFLITRLQLTKFEYEILDGELLSARATLASLVDLFEYDEGLKIGKQSNKVNVSHILLLASKLSQLSSFLNLKCSNNVDAVLDMKRSTRILQSILKNFLIHDSLAIELNMCYKLVLKLEFSHELLLSYGMLCDALLQLGLYKDFEFYEAEYAKLLANIPSQVVRCIGYSKLSNYSIYKNQADEAAKMILKVLETYQTLEFLPDFLILEQLSSNELYQQFVGDTEKFNYFAQKFDDSMDKMMKQLTPFGSSTPNHETYLEDCALLSKKWEETIFRRMISDLNGSQQTELNLGFQSDIISTKLSFNLTSKSMSADPKFSNLIESVVYLSCDRKGSLAASNIAKNFQECEALATALLNHSEGDRFQREEIFKVLRATAFCLSALNIGSESGLKLLLAQEELTRYSALEHDKHLSVAIENPRILVPPKSVSSTTGLTEFTFIDDLALQLPPNWTVITLGMCSVTSDLIVSKYRPNAKNPEILKLPLGRHEIGNELQSMKFSDASKELNMIIRESDETTRVDVTSTVKTKKDRSEWWARRKGLDKRLKTLLHSMEHNWFRGFKGIFGTRIVSAPTAKHLKQDIVEVFNRFLPARGMFNKASALEIVESNDLIIELFMELERDSNTTKDDIEDLILYLLDLMSTKGEKVALDEIDLDEMCSDIESKLKNLPQPEEKNDHHIVLIPSPECVCIPWESIPCLRNKSVSRMPSLELLCQLLKRKKSILDDGIDATRGYYILNPGGDLKRTEGNFKDVFETKQGWEGITGRKPTEDEIISGMSQSNLYVYVGHGGGEQYVRSKSIKALSSLPPALLLGCSSGNLKVNGMFKPHGTVYNYLIGGCPMLVANLWDVTDKDIDKFTVKFLEKWGFLNTSDNENQNIGKCVAQSRDVCILPYLNGAAPVLYGLPLGINSI